MKSTPIADLCLSAAIPLLVGAEVTRLKYLWESAESQSLSRIAGEALTFFNGLLDQPKAVDGSKPAAHHRLRSQDGNMKNNCVILSLGVLMALTANGCLADFDGCDNFNDNSLDTTRWGTFQTGVGLLTETNQHLEYTTSGALTTKDNASAFWIRNSSSCSNNWEVQVDVNMPTLSVTNGELVYCGLRVYPDTNTQNRFQLVLAQDDSMKGLVADVWTNGEISAQVRANTSSTNLAIRFAFDATANEVSAYVDEDAANGGYSWTLLGAATVPSAWNLTSSSVFNAQIRAGSSNITISASDHVFLDNFKAASGLTPKCQIQRTSGGVAISWPTNAPNFHLETTATLSPPAGWGVVTNMTAVVGTNLTVTNSTSSQTKFFRLSRSYGCE
jgi:hypothetical protein